MGWKRNSFKKYFICISISTFLIAVAFLFARSNHKSLLNQEYAISNDQISPLRSKKLININDFKYILHPGNLCQPDLFLFVFVHSAPWNFANRHCIRETWGNSSYYRKRKLNLIFILGATKNQDLQSKIEKEFYRYSDILQVDFIDNYRNLTYKYISGLKYVTKNCKWTPYILKSDDDMFVNIFALMKLLEMVPPLIMFNQLMCYVYKNPDPMRDVAYKWFVSLDEWPYKKYPDFCAGSHVVTSLRVIRSLYHASYHAPFFWIDDVYVTGVLAKMAGISHISTIHSYSFYIEEFIIAYQNGTSKEMGNIFCHNYKPDYVKITNLWKTLTSYYSKTDI